LWVVDFGLREEEEGLTGRNTLDTTTTGETTDGGLGDALDVVAEDLAVALGSALPRPLPPLPPVI
jgi:hypothetical protein